MIRSFEKYAYWVKRNWPATSSQHMAYSSLPWPTQCWHVPDHPLILLLAYVWGDFAIDLPSTQCHCQCLCHVLLY